MRDSICIFALWAKIKVSPLSHFTATHIGCNPHPYGCVFQPMDSPTGFLMKVSEIRLDEGFDLHFCPLDKNYGSDQCLHWSQQQSTGLLHFRSVRIPHLKQKKKANTKWCSLFSGRGWGIRTPANGVRVRCATVTLILYHTDEIYYTQNTEKVKHFFPFSAYFFSRP